AMPDLRDLNLDGADPDEAAVRALTGCRKLAHLRLLRTAAADAWLEPVGRIGTLQVLLVDRTAVGDAGLKHLGRLTELRALSLKGTRVTAAGVAARAAALPRCKVEWDGGTVGPMDPDWKAAEVLRPHFEGIAVRLRSGREVTVKSGDPLPAEPFTLVRLW